MDFPIIFEDDNLLVVDKPAGLVVNRSNTADWDTLQSWAEKRFNLPKTGDSDFHKRAGIVHRLDKGTSGLIIIAGNENAFISLQQQFLQRTVSKKYQTLAHGKVKPEEGTVKVPVGRLPWNRRKFGVIPQGREAITEYKVVSYYQHYQQKNNLYSLLEVSPLTGRTHQIRIHLKHLGYPIVGDSLYTGKKFKGEDLLLTNRIFLHASYLRFKHPASFRWIELNSDLPEELRNVISKLKNI